MKGVLTLSNGEVGTPLERLAYQGVHDLYSGEFMGTLEEGERASNRLVFIGKNLDEATLRAGFVSCAK
jgi:G3E family GTPase